MVVEIAVGEEVAEVGRGSGSRNSSTRRRRGGSSR